MKALILAAGIGKRLQPITNFIPKSIVEINGIPLLINSLNNLQYTGEISEIGIVVGHMADYIKKRVGNSWNGIPIRYFDNLQYLETNNIISLYKAVNFCDDDILLLECDIFYKKEIIEILKSAKGDCSILVSPFNPNTMNGTIIKAEGDKAKELILGKWQEKDFNYSKVYKTVNMYRFTKTFIQNFMLLIKWYIENQQKGGGEYYEKVLGALIYLRDYDIRVVKVQEDMWCEIDDLSDLERAKKIFANFC